MKLNAAAEMAPITWPKFAAIHPFVPPEQAAGYAKMLSDVSGALSVITGLPSVCMQPNSAQRRYTGLRHHP